MDDEITVKIVPRPVRSVTVPLEPLGEIPNTDAITTMRLHPQRLSTKQRVRLLHLLLYAGTIVLLLTSGIMAYGYYYYATTIRQPINTFMRPVKRAAGEPKITAMPTYGVIKGRSWNILLLGSDTDDKYTFPAVLTQVVLVLHVDTVHNSVSMVSIPRDSWVNIPANGMHKIDQAFMLGVDKDHSFESGVQLTRLTVEKDYGITIDRYAWIGLDDFAKVIDMLGGVDIDITHPLVDDNYPNDTGTGASHNDPFAAKRIYSAPGPQHLDGAQALEYVRSRHADQIGDIGRTQRQQQILEALKQKLTLPTIVNNLPALLHNLEGHIYTDLSEAELLAFANFGRTFNTASGQHLILGPGEQDFGDYASVYDPSTNSNQDVIIPNCQYIQPAMNRIFGLGNRQSCQTGG